MSNKPAPIVEAPGIYRPKKTLLTDEWLSSGPASVRLLKKVYHFLMRVGKVFAVFAAFAIVMAAFSITYGVFVRNILLESTIWELEAGIYLIIYATFLGAAYTHTAGGQIAIDLLRMRLSARLRQFHEIFIGLVTFALFLLIACSGWMDMWTAFERGWKSDTIWGPPLWIPLLSIPLGSALLALTVVCEVLLCIAGHAPSKGKVAVGSH